MSAPKPSKYLRIRIDVVVEWPEPERSIQMGGQDDYKNLIGAVAKVAHARGAVAIRESSIAFGADGRKRDADGKLIK